MHIQWENVGNLTNRLPGAGKKYRPQYCDHMSFAYTVSHSGVGGSEACRPSGLKKYRDFET